MTVSSELNRKTYVGNGVTTSFSTSPVTFFDSDDLDVYVVTTATGAVLATLTLNTHYSVSGGSGSTGTVNLAGGSAPYGAPAATTTLVIVRNLDITQESDLVNNDGSDAEVIEDALDRLTMVAQQHAALLDRSFTLADSDISGADLTVPTPEAGLLLGWNDDGDGLVNLAAADIDLTLVSPFVLTILDDVDAAAVRATIDAMRQRTIAGTAAEITVTNGDGVSGAPTLSLPTALTFTGKTVTGGTFASPLLSGASNAATGWTLQANGSNALVMTSAGEITKPLQPSFLAYPSGNLSNETGDGTNYTVAWNTEVFDQGSDFASNTFTAPVTGRYKLTVSVILFGLAAAHNSQAVSIVTSNHTYTAQNNFAAGANPFTQATFSFSVDADMDAADTATVRIVISNGTKVVGVAGGGVNSWFSGHLVC